MREILTQELSAQGAVEGNNFVQRGPDITLPAREAELLSMAFHELATNAVKHEALSAKDGRICITWVINRAENGEHVLLRWREKVSQLSSLQYGAVLALSFLKNQSSICLAAVLTEHFILTELNVRCSFGLKLTLPRPVSDMPRRYRSWRANNNMTMQAGGRDALTQQGLASSRRKETPPFFSCLGRMRCGRGQSSVGSF